MFKKKILIIDDTKLMIRIISDILTEQDYEVISALTGTEGLKKVEEEKPDLVILDVVMEDMDGFEVCRILRENDSNNLMPIIMLTSENNEDAKLKGLELGADDYIAKPFNKRELISRVNNTLRRIDRNRYANPLTGLHGNPEIQAEITRRISKNTPFAVIYADIDNFKTFNDVYGFSNGDRAIKLTADIISDCIHANGGNCNFVGHIGGDDFIIITSTDETDSICSYIIKAFDERIHALYNQKDVDRGFVTAKDRFGSIIKHPLMSISIAVVTNNIRCFENHIQVAEIAAELKEKAKSIPGSIYVKDTRKG